MSQAEQERSQEGREASGSEADAEQVQQFGAVFYITVAISAVFVLAGVFFRSPLVARLRRSLAGSLVDLAGYTCS